jgi:outer membrane protein insertion porin family
MIFGRLPSLMTALLCLCFSLPFPMAAQPAAQGQANGQAQPAQAPQPKKQNPFEVVPQSTEPAKAPPGQQPALEPPKPLEQPKPSALENTVEAIEFRGARRVPQDTLRALISTKKGDNFDPEVLRRDFMALWNTARFDDIVLESEPGKVGLIVRFVVVERRVVRSIKYEGIKSITVSEILDRFKERKVGLSVESQYDPNKVQRATVVLKEFLSERGHQYATVDPQIRQIPPSSLEVTFNIDEGPKVKVGHITIKGNQVMSSKDAIRAMKNSHPIGIPYAPFGLESIWSKTYDATKLDEDKERLREAYRDRGYFTAKVLDQDVKIRKIPPGHLHIPLIYPNHKEQILADINVPVEEGRQYHLNKITFSGVKLFRTPDTLMKPLFGMQQGDVFSTAKLRKGFENLKKLYGEFGYIDAVTEPQFDIIPNSDKIDLTLTAEEGKQFFVRRIDFAGNTTTRDKVIRREILLDEGDIFNSRLWELSLLRLNQLGYFEVLKEGEAADIKRNTQSSTVDITLKVKERGKNSIGLTGGISGIAGSFVGLNYSTNNFLGLGETLSLGSQLGTRMKSVNLGFTEPYFLDKPLQVGVVVYIRDFNYNQAREASILSGQNLIPLYNSIGQNNLLNYAQNSHGINFSVSYPLRRSFTRVGVTVGYDISNINVLSTAATQYFEYLYFQRIDGPNALNGVKTATVTPSLSYNTVNHPLNPTGGKSLFASVAVAGPVLGGNVRTIRPTVDAKYFHVSPHWKKNVIALHVMGSLLTGYAGDVAPPFSRTYIGGEQDIRGFQIWGISPVAYIPSSATVNVLNADGTQRTQKTIVNGLPTQTPATQTIPYYQLVFPGGDTQVVTNAEYRIPIIGPVTLAPFVDFGINKIALPGQLRLNPLRVAQLNAQFPQAGFTERAQIAPGTQAPRMSTGLELQVLLPVVNAPFRVYWAYNPLLVRTNLQEPIVADRSYFPNNATFLNAVGTYGTATPFLEQHSTFRFTIGRTF